MSIRILSCIAVLSLVHALGYAQDIPSASLREPLNQVTVLFDSGIVADSGGTTLYVAVEPLHWMAVAIPEGERIVGLAGGTSSRPLVLVQKDADVGKGLERYELKAVLLKGELVVVASDIPKPCVFLNDEIGAYADGGNIAITRDGARTWKSFPIQVTPNECIRRITWIGPRDIVCGGDRGSVCWLHVEEGNKATVRWTVKLTAPCYSFAPDGADAVWTLANELVALNTTDGRITSRFRTNMQKNDFCVGGQTLYVWGWKGLEMWVPDAGGFRRAAAFQTDPVASVISRGNRVFVLTMTGKLLSKEGDKLVEQPIVVQQVKVPTTRPKEDLPSEEEIVQMAAWSAKTDRNTRDRIFRESLAKKELTPRQRVLWTTEEFKKVAK